MSRSEKRRVLVTGAAGFIGSHVVDRLLADGCRVTGVDALTDYYPRETKLGNLADALRHDAFRFVEGDLNELHLPGLLADVDHVLHLAAQPGVRGSWGDDFSVYLDRNLLATQRLLEAMPGNGGANGGSFVFASSSSVYGSADDGPVREDSPKRPTSPYGLTKLSGEELVSVYGRERGFRTTVLRYFTVYGPRQRPEMALASFISAALEGRPLEVYGDGEQAREMTCVSDVVDATVSALEARPGIYNVGGGERMTVNRMIETVEKVLQTELKVRYSEKAAGDVRTTWADIRNARRGLGYSPKVGVEEGIRAQIHSAANHRDTTKATSHSLPGRDR